MNGRLLLISVVTMTLSLPARGKPARPLGCADPDVIGKALMALSNADWNNISETVLPTMWPTEISPIDCSAGACQTLGRQDRVINNECECCELFHLEVDRSDKGGAIKERLRSIVIYYSATNREETLLSARKLARALGLSEADAATIGREPQQHFYWDVDRGNQKEIALMDARLMHQQSTWKIYFLLSRHTA